MYILATLASISFLIIFIIPGKNLLDHPVDLVTAVGTTINTNSSRSFQAVFVNKEKDDPSSTTGTGKFYNVLTNTSVKNGSPLDIPTIKVHNRRATQCDLIHVATFVQSRTNTFELMNFLKRILTNRRNPLKFHIFVEESSTKSAVLEMISSWQVPEFDFFYEIQVFSDLDKMVPNFDSSTVTDRWKILIPAILSDIDNVIVADVNLQIIGDIADIWNKLSEMQRNESQLGLVEHAQSHALLKKVTPFT